MLRVPAAPVIDHCTVVFELPVTVAENCWVWKADSVTDVGVNDTVIAGVTVIVPPLTVTGMAVPVADAATPPEICIGTLPDAVAERVIDSTATTPFPIVVVLIALTTHMLFAQLIDLPAELAAEPMAAVTDWTPLGGVKVHCSAAG